MLDRFRLRSVPRVQDRDTQTGEVFDVSGDDTEPVVKSSRYNQPVSDRDLFSLQPALSRKHAPALRNRSRHRQNTAFKPGPQGAVEPLLQTVPALARR